MNSSPNLLYTKINIVSKEVIDDINKYFLDLPKHNIDIFISKCCIFNTKNNNEKNKEKIIKNFLSRIEEWHNHEGTIFWIIRLIQSWIERDIIDWYESYLRSSFWEYLKDFDEYILNILENEKHNYPESAINSLIKYREFVYEKKEKVIDNEMERVLKKLWIETSEEKVKNKTTSFIEKIYQILKLKSN